MSGFASSSTPAMDSDKCINPMSTRAQTNDTRPVRNARPAKNLQWLSLFLFGAAMLMLIQSTRHHLPHFFARNELRLWEILRPVEHIQGHSAPEAWLRSNTVVDYETPAKISRTRPKAAIISLVRNEELDGILQSMRQLEFYFNRRHNYPWIFFSEVPFSEEFKAATSKATAANTEYYLIPLEHWSTPPDVSQAAFYDSLDYLGALGVGKYSLALSHDAPS